MFVRPMVIADQVHIPMFGHIGFDVPQEREELLMAAPGLALRQYAAIGRIERREQGRLLALALQYNLSSYDAAYLHLALREQLPVAPRDAVLAEAARPVGVGVA